MTSQENLKRTLDIVSDFPNGISKIIFLERKYYNDEIPIHGLNYIKKEKIFWN